MNVSCANLDKKNSNLCDYYQKKQHFSVFIVLRLSLADHPRRHMMTNDELFANRTITFSFFFVYLPSNYWMLQTYWIKLETDNHFYHLSNPDEALSEKTGGHNP